MKEGSVLLCSEPGIHLGLKEGIYLKTFHSAVSRGLNKGLALILTQEAGEELQRDVRHSKGT